jgi:quercetin dioxygenase-like cupin family protein
MKSMLLTKKKLMRYWTEHNLSYEIESFEQGKVYPPHSHGWSNLLTLSGSIKFKIDGGEWIEQSAGDSIIIQSGQLHEAVVGPDGWQVISAWRSSEEDSFIDKH